MSKNLWGYSDFDSDKNVQNRANQVAAMIAIVTTALMKIPTMIRNPMKKFSPKIPISKIWASIGDLMTLLDFSTAAFFLNVPHKMSKFLIFANFRVDRFGISEGQPEDTSLLGALHDKYTTAWNGRSC